MATKTLDIDRFSSTVRDWPAFHTGLAERSATDDTGNRLVQVQWDVRFDELGHDWYVTYQLDVADSATEILQVWAKDYHPGIWIPEFRPWVAGVCEFPKGSGVKSLRGGIIDSKWRPEDLGQEYVASVWGYVSQQGTVLQFGPFEKRFTHPGLSRGAAVVPSTSGASAVAATGPTYGFGGLTIFTGKDGNRGIRATATLSATYPTSSWLISIHFCDAANIARFSDDVGGVAGGPWTFYVPVELLPQVMPIIRSEPNKFITYMWSNPGGGGYPIGKIGHNG